MEWTTTIFGNGSRLWTIRLYFIYGIFYISVKLCNYKTLSEGRWSMAHLCIRYLWYFPYISGHYWYGHLWVLYLSILYLWYFPSQYWNGQSRFLEMVADLWTILLYFIYGISYISVKLCNTYMFNTLLECRWSMAHLCILYLWSLPYISGHYWH